MLLIPSLDSQNYKQVETVFFTGLLDILSLTVHLQVFKTEGRTHQLTNYKPIARYIPRFSIPGLLNMSSSSPACGSELRPQLVRAPRLASNFHVQSDSAECKIYQKTVKDVSGINC